MIRNLFIGCFLLCAFLLVWAAFSDGADKPTTVFRVEDSMEYQHRPLVVLRPMFAYNLLGTPETASAVPVKGEVLRCTPGIRKVGIIPDPGVGTPADPEITQTSIMILNCGAVKLAVNGIDFRGQ